MAVFTPVSRDELARWLERYEAGELLDFEGIASGIENSNYFVTTREGRYVLTLFERLRAEDLPFHVGLMHRLAGHGVPCPDPVPDRDGGVLGRLMDKPAALFTRLEGRAIASPDVRHCRQVGEVLARMHRAAADYEGRFPNPRGLAWWREVAPRLEGVLQAQSAAMLVDEIEQQTRFARTPLYASLPASAVHADLFRDNVLFGADAHEEPRLRGVIDFWFAGVDTWLFDLAVAANDWCIDDAGDFDEARLAALLAAYRSVRATSRAEDDAWPLMLRAAALRFWLSRLFDLHVPRPAQIVTPKDPSRFERILRLRRAGTPALR